MLTNAHPSLRYIPSVLNSRPITRLFLTTPSSRAIHAIITRSYRKHSVRNSCLDIMSASSKAWSIDDVVKDVYNERHRADGTVEKVLTTEAWVHVGPYADVRYVASTMPDCFYAHIPYRSSLIAGKGRVLLHPGFRGQTSSRNHTYPMPDA